MTTKQTDEPTPRFYNVEMTGSFGPKQNTESSGHAFWNENLAIKSL